LYTPHARTAKPRPSVDKGSQRKSKKNSGSSSAKQQAKKKAQAKLSTISVDSEPPPKVHKQIKKKVGKGKRGYSEFTSAFSSSLQHEQQQPAVSVDSVGAKFQHAVSQAE
jgi:bifunctional pyridoxal-dependent enzyme with beta-cystathionase and maltose regulon repressor activities